MEEKWEKIFCEKQTTGALGNEPAIGWMMSTQHSPSVELGMEAWVRVNERHKPSQLVHMNYWAQCIYSKEKAGIT